MAYIDYMYLYDNVPFYVLCLYVHIENWEFKYSQFVFISF